MYDDVLPNGPRNYKTKETSLVGFFFLLLGVDNGSKFRKGMHGLHSAHASLATRHIQHTHQYISSSIYAPGISAPLPTMGSADDCSFMEQKDTVFSENLKDLNVHVF